MGASSSGISYQELADGTTDIRQKMSLILEYMMHELTTKDFISLSDPQQCKKYVLLMANHLYEQFHKLQVMPDHDHHGVLIFRSIRDLAEPMSEADKKEKQSLCLILSYFYTRIFQIYGALAMTLTDDADFMAQSGLLHRALYQRGGAPPRENMGDFEWIRTYLINQRHPTMGFKVDYRGEERAAIYFNYEMYEDKAKGRFYIIVGQNFNDGYLFDLESKYNQDKYKVNFKELRKLDGSKLPIVHRQIIIKPHSTGYVIYTAREQIPTGNYFDALLSDIIQRMRRDPMRSMRNNTLRNFTLRNARRNALRNTLRNTRHNALRNALRDTRRDSIWDMPYDRRDTRRDARRDPFQGIQPMTSYVSRRRPRRNPDLYDQIDPFQRDDRRTAEPLRMNTIIRSLQIERPIGHCIARARQLLEMIPLEGEPGITHICNTRFYEARAPGRTVQGTPFITKAGVPKPRETLDRHAGLSTAAILFYDAIETHTPKIVQGIHPKQGRESSLQQYISFMKELAKQYEEPRVRSDNSFRTGLASIQASRDVRRCSIQRAAAIPPAVLNQVEAIVASLFKTQLDHAAECYQIMLRLFDFRNLPRIELNDRLLQEGFVELDRINQDARDVLTRYYVNCENKYIRGTNLMLSEHVISDQAALPSTLPAALPAAPSALPAAPSTLPAAPSALPAAPSTLPAALPAAPSTLPAAPSTLPAALPPAPLTLPPASSALPTAPPTAPPQRSVRFAPSRRGTRRLQGTEPQYIYSWGSMGPREAAPRALPQVAPRDLPQVAPRALPQVAPRALPQVAPRDLPQGAPPTSASSSNVNPLYSRFWVEGQAVLPTTKYGTIHPENMSDIYFKNDPTHEFYYLSSFYTRPVAEGVYPRLFMDTISRPPVPYTSVEQYMAAKMIEHFFAEAPTEKATLLQTILSVRITPEYANRLIDRIENTLEPDEMLQWYGLRGQMDGLADTAMKQANLFKFGQNRDLRRLFLETNPRHLYYDVGDPIWGISPHAGSPAYRQKWGQNRLGNILESIRRYYIEYFRNGGTDDRLEAEYEWNDQDM